MVKLIIDGDILVYRAGFSKNAVDKESACKEVDDVISEIIGECLHFPNPEDYIVYLTGRGNFRDEIAVTHTYKGNRDKSVRPIFYDQIRRHMIDNYNVVVSSGEEADDLVGIKATECGPSVIVATTDKDMMQLACKHYNPRTGVHKVVSDWEALLSFYTQMLTGDTVDNIKGLSGIGPVKASKLLAECQSEGDLWLACLDAYKAAGEAPERLLENARLLHLRRYVGQIWNPPVVRVDK